MCRMRMRRVLRVWCVRRVRRVVLRRVRAVGGQPRVGRVVHTDHRPFRQLMNVAVQQLKTIRIYCNLKILNLKHISILFTAYWQVAGFYLTESS